MPDFFWTSVSRGLLPGQAGVVLGVERKDLRPLLEDVGDLRVGPLLLAGHQVDVEVVAVQAQVEDVERAHRGPAVLVAEGDRGQAVRLASWSHERLELVPGRRDGVVLVREDALAVEDRPRVVVDGDAVDSCRRCRRPSSAKPVGEVALDLGPYVVDRRRQALVREELHAEAGEPRVRGVRGVRRDSW